MKGLILSLYLPTVLGFSAVKGLILSSYLPTVLGFSEVKGLILSLFHAACPEPAVGEVRLHQGGQSHARNEIEGIPLVHANSYPILVKCFCKLNLIAKQICNTPGVCLLCSIWGHCIRYHNTPYMLTANV